MKQKEQLSFRPPPPQPISFTRRTSQGGTFHGIPMSSGVSPLLRVTIPADRIAAKSEGVNLT
jgi:hypothetical protein